MKNEEPAFILNKENYNQLFRHLQTLMKLDWQAWPPANVWPDVGVKYRVHQGTFNGKTFLIIKFQERVQLPDGRAWRTFNIEGDLLRSPNFELAKPVLS
jgi:hypothetical protein